MISAMGDVFGNKVKVITVDKAIKPVDTQSESALKTRLVDVIKKYHYENSIRLEENSRGIVIHILDDILFPSGEAEISSGSEMILNRLAAILKELPNDIRIEGHTDDVPIHTKYFPSNWHLSVMRALNTAYYLINQEKLSPDKISIVGYSEYKPIASNSTAEGRATNRRVDIVIVKK